MVDIVGWLALIVTLIYTCLGLPVQIYKNYKRKSTEGVSLFLIFFCGCTFLLWSIYALIKDPKDWYIFGSNFPGFIFTTGLLSQFWFYRYKEINKS